MPTIGESANAQSAMAAALRAGLEQLSAVETVTFELYVRFVLPLDGFVFWVKASLLQPAVLPLDAQTLQTSFTAVGSFHYATSLEQAEDASYADYQVVFTSETEINNLGRLQVNTMYVADYQQLRFAFSRKGNYYQQAALYHYTGEGLYSLTKPQLIDDLQQLDQRAPVLNNSTALWLALGAPTVVPFLPGCGVPLFPAKLAPLNEPPPFATIEVVSGTTEALQLAPRLDQRTSTHDQLVRETVRLVFYGVRADQALDFQDYVLAYTSVYDHFGVMNMPVFTDELRQQTELSVLAIKKSIQFEINYLQSRVRRVARQLILLAPVKLHLP